MDALDDHSVEETAMESHRDSGIGVCASCATSFTRSAFTCRFSCFPFFHRRLERTLPTAGLAG